MSRRERLREATRAEIKAVARRQMAEHGTAGLSLNAIARAMELVPSALYRYYPDRDALTTALILDAFGDLAAAVRAAEEVVDRQAYGPRLTAACLAYRRWALDHPVDFQLIFGNPIPGYVAPLEQTGPAMEQVFAVFLDVLQAAHAAGALRPVGDYLPEVLRAAREHDAFGHYPPAVLYSGLAGWSTMHGIVSLELFGFLAHRVVAGEAFYRGRMGQYLASMGLEG